MPNFTCQGLSFGSQSPIIKQYFQRLKFEGQSSITKYQHRGWILGANHRSKNINVEGWNSCLLWGPTYLLMLGAQAYCLCCFVLCNNHSEVRVPRPNIINNYTVGQIPRANHSLLYVTLQYSGYSLGPTSESWSPTFFPDSKSTRIIDLHRINDWQ